MNVLKLIILVLVLPVSVHAAKLDVDCKQFGGVPAARVTITLPDDVCSQKYRANKFNKVLQTFTVISSSGVTPTEVSYADDSLNIRFFFGVQGNPNQDVNVTDLFTTDESGDVRKNKYAINNDGILNGMYTTWTLTPDGKGIATMNTNKTLCVVQRQ